MIHNVSANKHRNKHMQIMRVVGNQQFLSLLEKGLLVASILGSFRYVSSIADTKFKIHNSF